MLLGRFKSTNAKPQTSATSVPLGMARIKRLVAPAKISEPDCVSLLPMRWLRVKLSRLPGTSAAPNTSCVM